MMNIYEESTLNLWICRSIIGNEVFMENIFTLMVLYVREMLSLRPIYPRVTKIEPALKAIVTTRPFSLPCK